MKLKLKPSIKIKTRYILLDAKSKGEVEEAILEYIGILGWARASCVFVNVKNIKTILSVDVKELNNVRAALEMSKRNIKILKVSGTLKGLEK